MSFPAFDEVWYIEMIERFSPDTGDPATDAHARAMLAAACIIAQALDGVAKAVLEHGDSDA
jgi:hypothetical protein